MKYFPVEKNTVTSLHTLKRKKHQSSVPLVSVLQMHLHVKRRFTQENTACVCIKRVAASYSCVSER